MASEPVCSQRTEGKYWQEDVREEEIALAFLTKDTASNIRPLSCEP